MDDYTVYIPTLNSERTLDSVIRGMLRNSIAKERIIIVDSGSVDKTLKIAASHKISVLKSKNLANGRNVALMHCRTRYIVFIDSDVVIGKGWLKKMMSSFKGGSVGACGMLVEKHQESLPDRWRAAHLRQNWGKDDCVPTFLFGSNTIYLAGTLRKIGGFDEGFKTNYEDVDISMRLKNKGYLLSYVPEAICYHLKRDTFISVLAMARRWSFHSYPNPSSLFKLILRIFIYNVHYFIHAFMADIRLGRLENLSITLTIPLYFAYYDVDHFMRPR